MKKIAVITLMLTIFVVGCKQQNPPPEFSEGRVYVISSEEEKKCLQRWKTGHETLIKLLLSFENKIDTLNKEKILTTYQVYTLRREIKEVITFVEKSNIADVRNIKKARLIYNNVFSKYNKFREIFHRKRCKKNKIHFPRVICGTNSTEFIIYEVFHILIIVNDLFNYMMLERMYERR